MALGVQVVQLEAMEATLFFLQLLLLEVVVADLKLPDLIMERPVDLGVVEPTPELVEQLLHLGKEMPVEILEAIMVQVAVVLELLDLLVLAQVEMVEMVCHLQFLDRL